MTETKIIAVSATEASMLSHAEGRTNFESIPFGPVQIEKIPACSLLPYGQALKVKRGDFLHVYIEVKGVIYRQPIMACENGKIYGPAAFNTFDAGENVGEIERLPGVVAKRHLPFFAGMGALITFLVSMVSAFLFYHLGESAGRMGEAYDKSTWVAMIPTLLFSILGGAIYAGIALETASDKAAGRRYSFKLPAGFNAVLEKNEDK